MLLPDNIEIKKVFIYQFVDFSDDQVMQEKAREKLEKLKSSTIPSKLPPENIIKYEVIWSQNG